jgi:hypothetical protein
VALGQKYCYWVDKGWDTRTPNYISSNPGKDIYLIIRVDDDGNKIKVTLGEILIDEEDMRLTKQYSLEFIKCNYNSKLYKAQLLRACINTIKVNTWVRDYNINLARVQREHLNTLALQGQRIHVAILQPCTPGRNSNEGQEGRH